MLVDSSGLGAEFARGVGSYFTGLWGTAEYAVRRSGALGNEEQSSAIFEGQIFAKITNQLVTNPDLRNTAIDLGIDYANNNPTRVSGRAAVVIGAGVIGSRAGPLGIGLAGTLNAAAINGNIRNAIHDGVGSAIDLVAPIVGGTR